MNENIRMGLLFLISEEDVRQPVAWEEFMLEAKNDVRMYCHSKEPLDSESMLVGHEIPESHQTKWGGFGVILAMYALLRAAVNSKELTHFAFVSESCIPIKPWIAIKETLAKDPRSRIDWNSWETMHGDHRDRRTKTRIARSFWISHSQWMIVDREVAEFLLDHEDSLAEYEHSACSDEHAIGGSLLINGFDMSKINRAPTTWARWSGETHPDTIGAPTFQLTQKWRDFEGFFARKFPRHWSAASLGMHRVSDRLSERTLQGGPKITGPV